MEVRGAPRTGRGLRSEGRRRSGRPGRPQREAGPGRHSGRHPHGRSPCRPEPGTAHGYHAVTYGWLAGEVCRRADGRRLDGVGWFDDAAVEAFLSEQASGPDECLIADTR
ncbi:MAG: beta-lactamase family protein [Actinomycetia bacterium]|nr:beta-lactamase family protein [Actinomycetes bacterium]